MIYQIALFLYSFDKNVHFVGRFRRNFFTEMTLFCSLSPLWIYKNHLFLYLCTHIKVRYAAVEIASKTKQVKCDDWAAV